MPTPPPDDNLIIAGPITVRRFYLPGVMIYMACETCGTIHTFKGDVEYVTQPTSGVPIRFDFACDHDYTPLHQEPTWTGHKMFTINVTVTPWSAPWISE